MILNLRSGDRDFVTAAGPAGIAVGTVTFPGIVDSP
jgi:hypothetical protein